jgi:hypothetical protein
MPTGPKSDLVHIRISQVPLGGVKPLARGFRDRFSTGPAHSSWYCKARKKQVAMIAQKVVDANQPE